MFTKHRQKILAVVITVLFLGLSACDLSPEQANSSANSGDTASDAQPDLALTIAANQTAIAQAGSHQAATVESGGSQTPTATKEAAQVLTVDSGDGGGDDWDRGELLAIIAAASKLEPLTPKNVVEELSRSEDGQYRYITEKHNVIENRESVLYLGQNDAVLYPGAIIHGKDVYDFVYPPVITSRTPITLSISLEGVPTTGGTIKETIDDPSVLSNVRQGVNNLLKSAITPNTIVPAKFSYESEQVYNSEERNLTLGVSGSYADVTVGANFNWNTETQKNKIMSIYKQIYYTVDVDMPQNSYDFFDPAIGADGLAAKLPPGSMPVYVSSVSYGWMAVLFIETDFSKDEMDTALSVAYDPVGDLEAELDFGYSTRQVFESSKIYIIVYGGSTAGITSSTLIGLSGLMELVSASKNFGSDSPGVPLSYTLRHLSDNLIAKIALTEEYTITRPIKLREFAKVTVDSFYCAIADDELGDNTLDIDRLGVWADLNLGKDQLSRETLTSYTSSDADAYQMAEGEWLSPLNAQTVLMLELERDGKIIDISAYSIVIIAYARDWDCSSCYNEEAMNSMTINGDVIYRKMNPIELLSDDFRILVFYTIQSTTYQEYCSYKPLDSVCQ